MNVSSGAPPPMSSCTSPAQIQATSFRRVRSRRGRPTRSWCAHTAWLVGKAEATGVREQFVCYVAALCYPKTLGKGLESPQIPGPGSLGISPQRRNWQKPDDFLDLDPAVATSHIGNMCLQAATLSHGALNKPACGKDWWIVLNGKLHSPKFGP